MTIITITHHNKRYLIKDITQLCNTWNDIILHINNI